MRHCPIDTRYRKRTVWTDDLGGHGPDEHNRWCYISSKGGSDFDPYAAAKAQSQANKEAVRESAKVNQINEVAPWGSIKWTGEIGEPDRTRTLGLSPDRENQYGLSSDVSTNLLLNALMKSYDVPAGRFSTDSLPPLFGYESYFGSGGGQSPMMGAAAAPQGGSAPWTGGGGGVAVDTFGPAGGSASGPSSVWNKYQTQLTDLQKQLEEAQGTPGSTEGIDEFLTSKGTVDDPNAWLRNMQSYHSASPGSGEYWGTDVPGRDALDEFERLKRAGFIAGDDTGEYWWTDQPGVKEAMANLGGGGAKTPNPAYEAALKNEGLIGDLNQRISGTQSNLERLSQIFGQQGIQVPGAGGGEAPWIAGGDGVQVDTASPSMAANPAAGSGLPAQGAPPAAQGAAPQQPGNPDIRRLEQATFDQIKNMYQPEYDRQRKDLENTLTTRGMPVGSEAWNRAMSQLDENYERVLTNAADRAVSAGRGEHSRLFGLSQAARQQGLNEEMLKRALPMNEIAAVLQGGPAMPLPNFSPAAQYQVAPPDIMGALAQQAQMNQSSSNAALGGVAGIAGSIAGALPWGSWFTSTAPDIVGGGGMGTILSRREFKDVGPEIGGEKALDVLDKVPVYSWNYKGDKQPHIGPMANDMGAAGVGDGMTLNGPDMMGINMAAVRELLKRVKKIEERV